MSKIKIFFLFCYLCNFYLNANADQIAKANGIEIWYETFGNQEDPPLLLVMGAYCQGIMWPTKMCEQFADAGFYVIRFDNRDTGDSTCFDFEKDPYDLLDMAKDAVGLLDFLQIPKAHLFGLSMGGPIVELIAAHFPDRVHTITLMGTSPDFRPCLLAFEGLPQEPNALSGPKESYLKAAETLRKSRVPTPEGELEYKVALWQLLNGSTFPLEKNELREMHIKAISRMKNNESQKTNHLRAIKKSESMIREVPYLVKVPTLILLGSEDPVYQEDHGEALFNAISGDVTYDYIYGMGHVPNAIFYDIIIREFKELAASSFSH